jgi:hypothetical protein
MSDEVTQLAGVLHEEHCGNLPGCRRWDSPASDHRQYYQDRARAITEKLEPAIGRANVVTAVRVILEEML